VKARNTIGLAALLALVSAGPAQANAILNSFTFYVDGAVGTDIDFTAEVYGWSGSLFADNGAQGATGPALYASPVMTYQGTGSFTPVTVTIPGGLDLPDGQVHRPAD